MVSRSWTVDPEGPSRLWRRRLGWRALQVDESWCFVLFPRASPSSASRRVSGGRGLGLGSRGRRGTGQEGRPARGSGFVGDQGAEGRRRALSSAPSSAPRRSLPFWSTEVGRREEEVGREAHGRRTDGRRPRAPPASGSSRPEWGPFPDGNRFPVVGSRHGAGPDHGGQGSGSPSSTPRRGLEPFTVLREWGGWGHCRGRPYSESTPTPSPSGGR